MYNYVKSILPTFLKEKTMQQFVTPNDTVGVSDSDSIQRAVDLAHAEGVNKVVIPRKNARTGTESWIITETVRLPSDMYVLLDNCFMQMADGVVGGFFKSETLFTEKGTDPAYKLHNITIRGEGHAVLDGGKPTGLDEGTQYKLGVPVRLNTPIFFMNVEGFRVENITVKDQRYWGLRFEFCSRGIIRDIFFDVIRDRKNQDGINLRNGCHDILIENIYGQTGDDMIALSAIDTDTQKGFGKDYPLIVNGESWDIHDVTIRNISGAAIRHPLVAMRNHNGAKIYNILIENVHDTPELRKAINDTFERYALVAIGGNSYAGIRHSVPGETYGITVRNITARYSVRAIYLGAVMNDFTVDGVNASGVCRAILATSPDGWANSKSGVKLDGASLLNVHFSPDSTERSKLLDFAAMRRDDYIKNLYVGNVDMRGVGALALVDDSIECFDLECGRVRSDNECENKVLRIPHYDDIPKELTPSVWSVRGIPTNEIDM